MKKGVDYPGISIVFLCHDGDGSVLMSRRGLACRDEQGKWDIGEGGLTYQAVLAQEGILRKATTLPRETSNTTDP